MPNRSTSSWKRWPAVVAALALMISLGAGRAQAQGDSREIKAREDFAAGRFQEALDIFARLYAETLHPIYLRNIARCYQNLGNPDRAIASFHDYLHKAKGLSADERNEIQGYIKEMEELKRQREAAATQPAAAQPAAAQPPPLPRATEPAHAETPQAVVVATPGAAAPAEESPVYTRWWFWTLIGAAAVAAGVGVAAATGAFNHTENASCPSGFACPR